jgi:hypothetical protein
MVERPPRSEMQEKGDDVRHVSPERRGAIL